MSAGPDFLVERQRLGAELRRLRQAARLSTYQLAQRLGWSQSKVSKIERARTAPSDEDVHMWAQAIEATTEQTTLLVERAQAALTEAVPWRATMNDAGLPEKQQEVAALEQTAGTVCYYQPITIPGPLQTPEYARLVFAAGNPDAAPNAVAEAVAARMQRQAILYDETKRLVFVTSEVALRWRYGPVSVQRAQLDRLRVVATMPNVTLGVLALASPLPIWHGHGFTLYTDRADGDDPLVHVETYTAAVNVSDAADVQDYQDAFQHLRDAAVTGDDLQALLSRSIAELSHSPS